MRITRKPLNRRTVLRGIGTTMALPFLEAMMPGARAADIAARPKRLQVFYSPNGMMMESFRPATVGSGFAMTPTLQPLEPFRDQIAVITGLGHPQAAAMGDRPAGHGRSCPAFLTGTHVRQTEGSDIRCAVSMDQVYARHLGDATQLSSLELGIDQASLLGSCDIGYSCAYTNGISWMNPTVPMPVTANPRDVFERLFGDGDALDEKSRLAQLRRQSSILDFVMDDAARLSGQLGAEDRRKLDEYLEASRAIEKRIQRAGASGGGAQAATLERPAGMPDSFDEHVRLMIDLQVLAMQADITRVGSFMIGRELSNRTYPEIEVPDSHHMLSHHGKNPDKIVKLARINRHHMEYFAYYLKRMRETRDGEGSLLDRTLVIRGSAFGDPNDHDHMDLPIVVAGGLVKGDRHVAVAKGTTMSNLLLAGLHLLDVPAASFGDSTGPLRELALA
ncbi:DUF1552 domain-containing protein [Novosphingobium album (ex Liu et al. 2023)]|uniref:DUF1552 domain-containing protein n=1 Tax=Novosphingobium album (ex Liu et al. 2023) TaxID=3031130 RepID=A0ABT5WR57_9SPHN|nr:DUF1552 domain-containing protein [Novosphingobium album (ex Liu et al. 2023)]MDE8652536.1 DUF1552 domain-containing protein [Novosphingobium album (ex Liu et al. 2023)]